MSSFLNNITDLIPSYLKEQDNPVKPAIIKGPLRAGEYAPAFRIVPEDLPDTGYDDGRRLDRTGHKLTKKARVVAFWSSEWNNYSIRFLKQLDAQQPAVTLMGGELFVDTDEDSWLVNGISQMHHLSLNFYRDPSSILASKFRLNEETNWTNKRFRLKERTSPYLGLYVIAPDNKIIFSNAWSLSWDDPSLSDLLSAVLDANNWGNS